MLFPVYLSKYTDRENVQNFSESLAVKMHMQKIDYLFSVLSWLSLLYAN